MKKTKEDVGSNIHVNEVFNDILNKFITKSVVLPINIRSFSKDAYEKLVDKHIIEENGGEELIDNNVDEL